MAQTSKEVVDFISDIKKEQVVLIDSRSESEFLHGHIPGAVNVPLLRDEERKIVGTIFKEQGSEAAVLKGFELVGPHFHEIIKNCRQLSPSKKIYIYCWRGGMRSGIMTWLLSTAGIDVKVLKGGYKSFRNWVLVTCNIHYPTIVLGGKTGSGKTEYLLALEQNGEQVLDLEGFANHKGSAFGWLGQSPQPSNEHFENLIATKWSDFNSQKPVWIENESRTIGSCILPAAIYDIIRDAEIIDIEIGIEKRIDRITRDYVCYPKEVLAGISEKIKKRLGPQNLKVALDYLNDGDYNGWLKIILEYYDKSYSYGNEQRSLDSLHLLDLTSHSFESATQLILETGNNIFNKKEIQHHD